MKEKGSIISLKGISRHYTIMGKKLDALCPLDLEVHRGTFTILTGRSGAGKSTLLNIIGFLDSPSSGTYIYNDLDASNLTEFEKSRIRLTQIGFIFQSFRLIQDKNVLENIILPMKILGTLSDKECIARAEELALKVNLQDRLYHLPAELSGGESQRVAIARAQANSPTLFLADEPTGNLDLDSRDQIISLLKSLQNDGCTIIMVTHDLELCKVADINVSINK